MAKNEVSKEEKKEEAPKVAAPHVSIVQRNNLRPGIYYIKLSNGKQLATRSEAHFDVAIKSHSKSLPVSYKEEICKADGHMWLSEFKLV